MIIINIRGRMSAYCYLLRYSSTYHVSYDGVVVQVQRHVYGLFIRRSQTRDEGRRTMDPSLKLQSAGNERG